MSLLNPIVDFIIIGAQKSATTTLFDILKTHPKLAASKKKEPEFFSHTIQWEDKILDYHRLFNKQEGQLAFEASTAYTAHPFYNRKIWQELYKYNPNLKLIYIVRDPLDRIVSAHRFLYRQGYANKKNINTYIQSSNYHTSLSKYYFQIKPYIDLFGSDNVKIVFFEDIVHSQHKVVNEILRFLGLNAWNNFTHLKSNTKHRKLIMKTGYNQVTKWYLKSRKYLPYKVSNVLNKQLLYREINSEDLTFNSTTLLQLKQELLPDIEQLEKLLAKDLSHWKNKINTHKHAR